MMLKAIIIDPHRLRSNKHEVAAMKAREIEQNKEQVVEDVADIEAIIQPIDAWDKQSMMDALKIPSNQLLIAESMTVEDKDNQKAEGRQDKQVVLGYCLYQQLFDQAEILRIGTHPSYQRQGVARQLLLSVICELQNKAVDTLLLEVRADNHAAIALYQRFGFELIHKRLGYYQQRHQPAIDALVMQKRLT